MNIEHFYKSIQGWGSIPFGDAIFANAKVPNK